MKRTRLIVAAAALSLVAPFGSGASSRATDAPPHGVADRSFPLQAAIRAADAGAGDNFGVSVAISGNTAIVGASREDGGAGDPRVDAGAAYIFGRNKDGASRWGQVQKLTASDSQSDDWFGNSVGVSGDFAIVGAFLEDGGLGDPLFQAGAAYVFQNFGGSGWFPVKTLRASDAQSEDNFGFSVAISGNTAIVGAYQEDGGSSDPLPNAGAAYVFRRDQDGANMWGEVKKLVPLDRDMSDQFGSSVGISGKLAVVGSASEDGGPGDPLPFAGSAYIFMRHLGGQNAWGQAMKLFAPDAQARDNFGVAVAVSGKHALIGGGHEDGGPGDPMLDAGAAYVFYASLLEAFKAN